MVFCVRAFSRKNGKILLFYVNNVNYYYVYCVKSLLRLLFVLLAELWQQQWWYCCITISLLSTAGSRFSERWMCRWHLVTCATFCRGWLKQLPNKATTCRSVEMRGQQLVRGCLTALQQLMVICTSTWWKNVTMWTVGSRTQDQLQPYWCDRVSESRRKVLTHMCCCLSSHASDSFTRILRLAFSKPEI